MKSVLNRITGIHTLLLIIIVSAISCEEQPARTNPYDPENSSPPYTIIGKVYTNNQINSISSFSINLELENLDGDVSDISPVELNDSEIIRNINSDTLKMNWVNTESPIEFSANDTLFTVKWKVNEGLEGNVVSISDFILVNSETGESIDMVNLGTLYRVE